MSITPLFDPAAEGRPMRVGAFMSGSGTNIIKLIEREKALKSQTGSATFEVVFIFSDRSDGACRGEGIARENGLPYISYDIRAFHHLQGIKRTVLDAEGLDARKEFDRIAGILVEAFEIDVIALGGYMSYITLNRCINVHPADLSILTDDGKRKYVGDHAVLDAIVAGETELRSSTLWTDEGVDTGPLLMVSSPLEVKLPIPLDELLRNRDKLAQVADAHQERLKEIGDWRIFPRTVEMIAEGRFGLDGQEQVYVDGHPLPAGYRESSP